MINIPDPVSVNSCRNRLLSDRKIIGSHLQELQETVGPFAGCNPEDPPNDGDTTIEFLTEDCLGLILDMVRNTLP
jgi:hypothetical protein